MKSVFKALLLSAALSLVGSCTRIEQFEDIGTNVASPTDIVLSKDESHLYLLNSDIDRRYGDGSILVLKRNGSDTKKVTTVKTPRIGRFLTRVGNTLIAGFDSRDYGVKAEESSIPELHIYDISNPAEPVLKKKFTDEFYALKPACTPINAVAVEGYKYFAVACASPAFSANRLFIGTFGDDLADTTIKHVRSFGEHPRRAMYIDANRDLLFAFRTNTTKETYFNEIEDIDELTYADTREDTVTDGGNEIPDQFEKSYPYRKKKSYRRPFQFVMYDIKAEANAEGGAFPFRDLSESESTDYKTVESEYRWIYFNLTDFDGTPDRTPGFTDPTRKHYRTDFWQALPDRTDPNVFYLSHRSKGGDFYNFSNNIVKVRIVGDPRSKDFIPPKTDKYLQFSRVFGFRGEAQEGEKDYTGDFEIQDVNGQNVIVVNHFRDLSNFDAAHRHFSLAAKSLQSSSNWFELVTTADTTTSYYQFALASDGIGYSCSFYGNAVIPFQVVPGNSITILNPEIR